MATYDCSICGLPFADAKSMREHFKVHENTIPSSQVNFIPEIERDEYGNIKPRAYKQKPYEPATDYGG